MKRVWVAVTNDLHTDQRVNKVCLSLQNAGFEPILIGVLRSNSSKLERGYATRRMRIVFQKTFLFYAEYNIRLFFKLLFSKFDIVIANDTDTLLATFCASKLRGKTIVFDAHELFTEVPELVGRPFVKRIWQCIEDAILPHIKYAYTVCQPIAEIYKKKNGINMQVVRNAPFRSDDTVNQVPRLTFSGKKMILYQGAINIGRGIEWIIDAMPFIDNAVFCIAGDGDIVPEIKHKIVEMKLQEKVILLGKIPLEELQEYTYSANLGVCLLENRGLNYYYSLPNRVFDFAQAGIPILATDFPEIRNVVAKYQIGELINEYEPKYLAQIIEKMLDSWHIDSQKQTIFAKAKQDLCWEKEELVLLSLFSQIE
ncbi:MAG: glycosyltransferase [Bacteroidales bacterium]|nr:glycosyltransferase [Bacteroidales bacterium]